MRYSVIAVAALVLCGVAHAQIYKWKDADGSMHYSDTPPVGKTKTEVVNVKTAPVTALPPTVANKPGTTPAPSAPVASATADAAQKDPKQCAEWQNRMSFLQSAPKLQSINEKGNIEMMDAASKPGKVAEAQQNITKYCP